jgi:hypothetical protein
MYVYRPYHLSSLVDAYTVGLARPQVGFADDSGLLMIVGC